MDRLFGGLLVLALGLSGVAAGNEIRGQQQATPEQQYQALLEQYNDAFQEYTRAFREAKLPEDRLKAIQEKYPRPGKWAVQFLQLAEKNPRQPFAEEALIWIMTSEARLKRFRPWHEHTVRYEMIWIMQARSGRGGDQQEREVRSKAIDMLIRDHVTSVKMGYVAQMLSRSPKSAKLLRAIIDENPSQEIKAEACLALSREIQGDIALARQLKANPESAKSSELFYGKDYVEEMQKADLARLEVESENVYADLTGKYILDMKPARLVELCQELKYSNDSEKLLRLLYVNHQRDEVRGVAGLILAQVLMGRAFSLAATDANTADKLRKEGEMLLEEAAGKYAGVLMPREGTVGKKAEGMLVDLRHLSIGKAAPEIEGVDQDGKQFALSDYKGKVVLLDFWSEF
jgi:uncharacterized protein (DUF305 family)